MNKTDYFIECLELMGWIFLGRGIWRKPQGSLCGPLHEDELQSLTIQELIKRDGVMERVRGVTGNCTHRYVGQDNDVIEEDYTPEEFIQYAIELMTPKELMGVEG